MLYPAKDWSIGAAIAYSERLPVATELFAHGPHGGTNAYLLETNLNLDGRNVLFGRAEYIQKKGHDLVLDDEALEEETFPVGVLALGYLRNLGHLGPVVPGVGLRAAVNFVPEDLESTYGGRDHRPFTETVEEFVGIVKEAVAQHGKILVPTFAVGRAQLIMLLLAWMFRTGKAKPFPIFLDSPMAIEATNIYVKHKEIFDERTSGPINAIRADFFSGSRSPSLRSNTMDSLAASRASARCAAVPTSRLSRLPSSERYGLSKSPSAFLIRSISGLSAGRPGLVGSLTARGAAAAPRVRSGCPARVRAPARAWSVPRPGGRSG